MFCTDTTDVNGLLNLKLLFETDDDVNDEFFGF